MIKKMTFRFDMENEKHRLAYEKIAGRDKNRYKYMVDYVCEAAISMSDGQMLLIDEKKLRQIVREMVDDCMEKKNSKFEPGL